MERTSTLGHPAGDDDLQTTLRRIERLVGDEVDGQRVFDGVTEALGRTVGADAAWLIHVGSNGYITNLAVWSTRDLSLPVGTRQAISDELRQLRESRRPYRVDLATLDPDSPFAAEARRLGIATAVGVPVLLAGQVWALAVVARHGLEPFGGDTETRMASFIAPVTGALAAAWTSAKLEEWHAEQGALRRLAELATAGLGPEQVLQVIVAEVSVLVDGRAVLLAHLDDDGSHGAVVASSDARVPVGRRFSTAGDGAAAGVLRSGRPERIDDYTDTPGGLIADELGARAVVAAPVEVEGRLWGILAAASPDEPLPTGTESRLTTFAEIAVTALSIARAREQLQRLADEQAALLRVSQLVTDGTDEHALFDAVVVEAAGLITSEATTLARLDGPRTLTVVATCGGAVEVGRGREVAADEPGAASEVIRTQQPARRDSHRTSKTPAVAGREDDLGSIVSVPVTVDGQLWGLLESETEGQRLPPETEDRLQQLADLVAASIANRRARTEVVQLADEQSALRRVAELVARGASLPEVFDGVSVEASRLLGVGSALLRFDPDGYAEIVATHNGSAQLGLRIPTTDSYLPRMFAAGQGDRLADYREVGFADAVRDLGLQAGTAVPIIVEGKIWGALKTSPSGAALRPGTESNVVSKVADKLEKSRRWPPRLSPTPRTEPS